MKAKIHASVAVGERRYSSDRADRGHHEDRVGGDQDLEPGGSVMVREA